MTLIDSACWIAYFLGDPPASMVERYARHIESVIVPTLVIYEVFRKLTSKIGDREALFFITQLQKGEIIPLEQDVALRAAELSLKYKMGMADAIIYSTTLTYQATLITLDNDFRALPHCVVIK